MENIRCLSIKQPYCDLILSNKKIFEIRSWKTKYRGDLLICSSLKPAFQCDSSNFGVSICIAELIDIVPFLKSHTKFAYVNHSKDLFSWVLSNIRPVENVVVKGRLSLYQVPTEIESMISRYI